MHWNWNSAQIPQILNVGTSTGKCGTGTILLGGTGTGLPGTGTTWPLLISCFGVSVPIFMVSVPIPLSIFLLTVILPKVSR